jgi:hypothetical protein
MPNRLFLNLPILRVRFLRKTALPEKKAPIDYPCDACKSKRIKKMPYAQVIIFLINK